MKETPGVPQAPMVERVISDVIDQSIPALSDWTLSIPLTRDDFTHGELILAIKALASRPNNRRNIGYYKFSTALNDAQGVANELTTGMISLCVYYDRWPAGYAFRNDGKLSAANLDTSGSGTIQLTSIRINGAAIDMVFRNVHATLAAMMTVYIMADVWKV